MNALLADAVVLLHFGFILFVVLGATLLLRWPRLVWLHLPCLAWGIWIEFSGTYCPLTPLEDLLRTRAGRFEGDGSFIDRFIMPLIYIDGLTYDDQLLLGAALIAVNAGFYALWIRRGRQRGITWPNSSTR